MGVRYCGDSERRELFEKWRRPPKAERGRTVGRREGRTDGLTSRRPHRRRRTESRTESGGRIGRESWAAERGMAGRRAVGRRAGCKYVRETIIIVVVEGGGVGAVSRPTDDVTQYIQF